MNTAQRIYSRPGLINKVKETHNTIRTTYNQNYANLNIDPKDVPLIKSLAVPGCRVNTDNLDIDLLLKIENMLLNGKNGKEPTVNDFRELSSSENDYSYTLIQNNVMVSTYKFVQVLKKAGFEDALHNPKPKIQTIEAIGLHTVSASTALAIKDFWIYKNYEGRFRSNAAFTSPVKKFYKRLFGSASFTQAEVNQITFETAYELDKDPLWINTAQWCIGHYFLK